MSYDREEAAHGWGFLLWHPLGKAQALSNTYWNGDLRVGNGLLCSSLASMSTILKLLVEGQCYFMDYLGCCLEKSSEVSWSVFWGISGSSVQGKYNCRTAWSPSLSWSISDSPGDAVSRHAYGIDWLCDIFPPLFCWLLTIIAGWVWGAGPGACVVLCWPLCDSPMLGLQKPNRDRWRKLLCEDAGPGLYGHSTCFLGTCSSVEFSLAMVSMRDGAQGPDSILSSPH